MKVNAINMIRQGANGLRGTGDNVLAYGLHELANNLLAVMQGRATWEEFQAVYVAQGSEPIDLDVLFPTTAE